MKTQLLIATAIALLAVTALRVVADDKKPGVKRELLSSHSTIAQLTAIEARQCRGRTSLCPDNCGQSGDFADFKIVAYLAYTKPGEYGDPKATTFTLQLNDNHGALKLPKATVDAIRGLKAGDYVRLDWNHDYVTTTEPGGGSSSSPDRPVTTIQPLTKEQAEQAIKDAAKK